MRLWPFIVAAGFGLMVLVGAFAMGFVSLSTGDETVERLSLCDHLNGYFAEFGPPLDVVSAAPLAVLDSPDLALLGDGEGDSTSTTTGDEWGASLRTWAAQYILPSNNIIGTAPNVVAVPDEVADDYTVFAEGLYQVMLEQRPEVRDDPEVRQAAEAVDQYIRASCGPPLGTGG